MSKLLSNMPLVLHLPHSSKLIPKNLKDQFILGAQELEREVNLITDHFTDWILSPLGILAENQIVAPISRLVVDMERFCDDKLEIVSKIGMGVIYEKGSQLQPIRRKLSADEKQTLLAQYYISHHEKLEARTQLMLQRYEKAIIIDVHSYPQQALP